MMSNFRFALFFCLFFSFPTLWLAEAATPEPGFQLQENGLELRQIPPYIIMNSTEETVISWVSHQAYAGSMEIWNDYQRFQFNEETASRFHKASFSGLLPETLYQFRNDLGQSGSFTTPFRDNHTRFTAFGHTGGTRAIDEFPVQHIFQLIEGLQSDFTLLLGDFCLFASVPDCKTEFFDIFRPLLEKTTLIPAPGNHEKSFNERGHRNTLDNFRSLFPYPYPQAEGENAYFSFTYKNIRFYSVTLTKRPKYMDKNVLTLFEQDIKKSTSDFNIVFWGGENKIYDEEYRPIFELFNQYKVDAIFGGADGGKFPWRKEFYGVPYYFAGSLGERDRQFFYVDINDYFMKVRVFNSSGAMTQQFHQYARKTFEPKYILDKDKTYPRSEYTKFRGDDPILEWHLDDIPSEEINGVVINADCYIGDQRRNDTVSYLHWVSEFPGQGEAGMNRLAFSLKNRVDQQHVLALPDMDPFSLTPYHLNRLALRFANCPNSERIVINDAYIF